MGKSAAVDAMDEEHTNVHYVENFIVRLFFSIICCMIFSTHSANNNQI